LLLENEKPKKNKSVAYEKVSTLEQTISLDVDKIKNLEGKIRFCKHDFLSVFAFSREGITLRTK